MIALARFALLALVAIVCLALTAEARELLDYYDDCYNGACPDIFLHLSTHAELGRASHKFLVWDSSCSATS